MDTTSIGDRELAGLVISAFVPNTIDDIGCLVKRDDVYLLQVHVFTEGVLEKLLSVSLKTTSTVSDSVLLFCK
jgi:hypothetical protein